jgi:NADH:ubiquinone oxidoreductase subunit H
MPFCIPLFPLFIVFLISMLAETNRSPFDLPEAEAELVAGYNVEYSSIFFALFFLAEYTSMILISFILVLIFLNGWFFLNFISFFFLYLKLYFFIFFFI